MKKALLLAASLLLAACSKPLPWAQEPLEKIRSDARAGLVLLVDARPAGTWAQGHVPEALTLPSSELNDPKVQLSSRYFGRPVYVYGASGSEAQKAARSLVSRRVDARPLEKGYADLIAAGGVVPAAPAKGAGEER